MTYILITASEDGARFSFFDEQSIQELLDDPRGNYGVTTFGGQTWFEANSDPMYWKDGYGVLLTADTVIPVPAGNLRLP